MKYEFTIFGSGISAKITSCILARNGFKVCLISDRDQVQKIPNTNLVTFLSSGSLSYFSSMFPNALLFDEYPEINKIICQLQSLNTNKAHSIKFKNEEKESLGKIVKNTDLENFLDKEIHQLTNINIINSDKPNFIEHFLNGIKIKMDNGEYIESDLFILSSTKKNITEQIKINFIKKDLEQDALSIMIEGVIKNENCAFQKFSSDGPLALLPYSKNEASVVWSLKNNSKILKKNNEELSQIISEQLEDHVHSIKIKSIEKHQLQFTYAKNLYYKNTVLLGNIAHNIHPIAGQGLNLSIKDIALFVKLVSKYTSLGYKANNQMILKEFEMKRKLDNTVYSFGTFSLNDILSSSNKFINYTTRKGLGLVEKSQYIKRMFIKSATGKDFFNYL